VDDLTPSPTFPVVAKNTLRIIGTLPDLEQHGFLVRSNSNGDSDKVFSQAKNIRIDANILLSYDPAPQPATFAGSGQFPAFR
jgi:hypothetical protein